MKKAKVDGVEVPSSAVSFELDRLVKFYRSSGMTAAEIKQNMPSLREKALEQAIGAMLIRKRADSLDIAVSGDEIDAEFERTAAAAGGREKLRAILARNGIPEESLRSSLAKSVKMNKIIEQACTGVEEPSEKEVEAFYESHKAQYAAERQVYCRHILAKGDEPGGMDGALEKIRSLRRKILDGGDFAQLAKEHSDCPSGRDGGSLGWFSPGMMVEAFDKAAFGMKKGEVSEPVQTQFGWHLIFKVDEKDAAERPLAEVHDDIKSLLRHQARGRALDAFVAELRKGAEVEYYDD